MKKLLFSVLAFVSLVGLFVSCGEESQPPAIELTTGGGYYVSGTPVAPGAMVKIGVTASANETSLENITNITVTRGDNTELASEACNDQSISKEWNITSLETDGTETITIVATDNAGQTAELTVDLVTDKALDIVEHTVTLGAQDNVTGSFCASFEGTVWTTGELKSGDHYAEVDIIYYYGATNKSALFSPKAIVDNDISWGGLVPVANWTTANETKFVKATASDFTNATYYTVETLATAASLDIANGGDDPVEGLANGDAYAFKTADGKYGIFSISGVTGTNDGTISLSIKIQN
jgi:hypothetical protein